MRSAWYGLQHFFSFLDAHGVGALADIDSDLLREFEGWMVGDSPTNAADRTRSIWMYLRELPDGVLDPRTATFVTHPPGIAVMKVDPTEALPDETVKEMIKAARLDVAAAERRLGGGGYPTQRELTAFYILLLWELAWSMDLLKALNFGDGAPTTVLNWDVADGDFVEIKWLKKRGGSSGTRLVSAAGTWSAGALLRRLEAISRDARQVAERPDNALIPGSPWLVVSGANRRRGVTRYVRLPGYAYVGDAVLMPMFDGESVFKTWLQHHPQIPLPDDYDRLTFRAIRPAAKAARVTLTDTSGLMMADLVDDHTIEVYSSRYMRSARLMRDLGRVFLEDIAGRAEDVVRVWEPMIVLSPTEQEGPNQVTAQEAQAALDGDLEFGLTACQDPYDSPMPGQREGDLCGVAFRACFTCPKAIVTPRHYTRMVRIKEIAEGQRQVLSPPEWVGIWGDLVAFIDKALVRLEPYAPSTPQAPPDVLDLGLRGAPKW